MKLEITKDKLLEAVSICERVSGKHVSLPVLSSVVLEAKKNELIIKATNLDIGVEFGVPCKVVEGGVSAVSGSVLKACLTNFRGNNSVSIETKEGIMLLNASGVQATIKTLNHEDFPAIPMITDGNKFIVSSRDFVKGVTAVWYSASVSSIKPELSSVFLYSDNDNLVFVATDSFRLAEKKIKTKKGQEILPILIPFKNIVEISRIFGEKTGDINVIHTKNQISFFTAGIHVTSRVIEGNFPDYKQIVPKEFVSSVIVLKEDFLQALKLTSVFSDTFNQVFLSASSKSKTLEIKTRNNDVGEGAETIKGSIDGEDIGVNFNHKYLFDCLQSIEDESVLMRFAGQGRPLVITPARNEDFVYLIMPMNR